MHAETANQPINFMVNDGTSNLTPLKIYANGVLNVGNNIAKNKILSIYDSGSGEDVSTAINFYGFWCKFSCIEISSTGCS